MRFCQLETGTKKILCLIFLTPYIWLVFIRYSHVIVIIIDNKLGIEKHVLHSTYFFYLFHINEDTSLHKFCNCAHWGVLFAFYRKENLKSSRLKYNKIIFMSGP